MKSARGRAATCGGTAPSGEVFTYSSMSTFCFSRSPGRRRRERSASKHEIRHTTGRPRGAAGHGVRDGGAAGVRGGRAGLERAGGRARGGEAGPSAAACAEGQGAASGGGNPLGGRALLEPGGARERRGRGP